MAPAGAGKTEQRAEPLVLALGKNADGYPRIFLKGRGDCKVHRLVLESFAGPCPVGKQACHRNGVRDDNRIENLRWGTKRENENDKITHGTKLLGSRTNGAILDEAKVAEIKRCLSRGERRSSLAKRYDVSHFTISDIARGIRWTHVPWP